MTSHIELQAVYRAEIERLRQDRDDYRLAAQTEAAERRRAHEDLASLKAQADALAWAMWQLLDDMGEQGTCVCLAAKAQARIAYEPFWQAEKADGTDMEPMDMPLSEAEAIMERVERS